MATKLGRNIGVEVVCEECEEKFIAKQSRVKEGKSRFCSLPCYHINLKKHKYSNCMGYENAKPHYDIVSKRWMAHWMDENFKQHSTTYPRWLWTMHYGEIPEGMKIEHGGADKSVLPELCDLVQTTQAKLNQDIKDSGRGFKKHTDETKKKLSELHTGKKLSDEHRQFLHDRFAGEGNPQYKDGRCSRKYPREFYRIKPYIFTRDGGFCQACGIECIDRTTADIHHIDADRQNSKPENLILLCRPCHRTVHGKNKTLNATINILRERLT